MGRQERIAERIAFQTAQEVREVLFAFADRNPAFKSYMLSGKAPRDADLILWLIQEVEAKEAKESGIA